MVSLVSLLVALLIFCVFVWAARYLVAAFDLPAQLQAVVTVVVVLLGVLWLLTFLQGAPTGFWRIR